jgi:transposase-like protein
MNLPDNDPTGLFKRCHFDSAIILLCVRWYLTYKLSSRDLVAMMAERNVDVAHTTILRWVQCYVPEFEKRWQRYARPVGISWRIDETYIKVKGRWVYLYRAVDKAGQTVDFLLSEHRDTAAAKRFFEQAIERRGVPEKITLDGYAASHEAVAELQEEDVLPTDLTVRTNKYLNNVIEQDHRRVKQRVRPMLGFKRFDHARVTLAGIELAHQIKKRQFDLSALCSSEARTPQMWDAVLAA